MEPPGRSGADRTPPSPYIRTIATAPSATSPVRRGSAVPMYGMGVAVGDFNNDGWPDLFISCLGQSRLFQNTGKGSFIDVTRQSRSRRPGGVFEFGPLARLRPRRLARPVRDCNYVKWAPDQDIFCSVDGKEKSYCTPEAYRGQTCWLFRNLGNGKFEDVTAKAGLFDSSSKSLGATAPRLRQRRLAGPVRRQRHAAEQAVPQPAQRHLPGGRGEGRRRLQRRRQGARRNGCGRRPTSTTRASRAWWSPTSTTR